MMETARNSTFKNPFAVQCAEAASSQEPSSLCLVPGRSIAAAAAAAPAVEAGKFAINCEKLCRKTIFLD